MRCSFVVSTFERPDVLAGLLCSLKIQTEPDFEVIITDNSRPGEKANRNRAIVDFLADGRFRYFRTELAHCYASANVGALIARGDYLCFPSDDNYYVPGFLKIMLSAVPRDLIYCDVLYDPRSFDRQTKDTVYRVIATEPKIGGLDKGGFLVRREKFVPFHWTNQVTLTQSDGVLAEDLIRAGVTHAKVPGILWAHN